MRWYCREKFFFLPLFLLVLCLLLYGAENAEPFPDDCRADSRSSDEATAPASRTTPPHISVPGTDNLLPGEPDHADLVIDRIGYALGYNCFHKQAQWVQYKLTAWEATTKAVKRNDRFRDDPAISDSGKVADYRQSGYDRGHLAPAADMLFSKQAMTDSFYMTNMSPQKPMFNRNIWKKLETQVRTFAIAEREIYVVTGPILPKEKTITIGINKVTVPGQFYKIVYDVTPPQKMIAFVLPNEASSRPLTDFVVTVDYVEELTGLDFFQLVPEPQQTRLESTITIGDWKWGNSSVSKKTE